MLANHRVKSLNSQFYKSNDIKRPLIEYTHIDTEDFQKLKMNCELTWRNLSMNLAAFANSVAALIYSSIGPSLP